VKQFVMHLVESYGYPGIFGTLVIGIFGAPIPDEILLSFAGYLAFKGELKLHLAILTAFLGSICGISLSYGVGRFFGLYLFEKYGRFVRITPERMRLAHDWFGRYGKWTLVAGYFIPGLRHLIACLAGASRLGFSTFALFAFTGGLFWTGSYIIFGYYMGKDWNRLSEKLHQHLLIGSIAVAAALLGWFLIRRILVKCRTKEKG
jgi:membrane protein DedA with SNARE-associated domain